MSKENLKVKQGVSNRGMILILIIAIIVIGSIVIIVVKNNNAKNELITPNASSNTTKDEQNYIATEGTSKLNVSTQVAADKKVGDVLIQNSKISFDGKTTTLTAKVTNGAAANENLRFKVAFIANDGTTIAETVGILGKTAANESKYIKSEITTDLVNTKDITYEIIK